MTMPDEGQGGGGGGGEGGGVGQRRESLSSACVSLFAIMIVRPTVLLCVQMAPLLVLRRFLTCCSTWGTTQKTVFHRALPQRPRRQCYCQTCQQGWMHPHWLRAL